jgi:cytochrome P450
MTTTETPTVTISTYAEAWEAYTLKELRQALYDAGEIVMKGVLVNLHGEEHRARRRLENRLFRRETFAAYEREWFPAIIEETFAPHIAAGRAELVSLGHHLMMNLAAHTAGVDRPERTPEETERLYGQMMWFIAGATLGSYTGDDRAEREERIREAMQSFDTQFLRPSIERRRALIDGVAAGAVGEDELPRDVLTVLLRNQDDLELPAETVLRETAFFLLAGAHTSATALTRATDSILDWIAAHPEDEERVMGDRLFVQRCVHETVRLEPSSPVAARWALADCELSSGTVIPAGAKVVIDLIAVNRDPAVFGDSAAEFDPYRELPDRVAPHGLSFGRGMHACIGQDLAVAPLSNVAGREDDHLFGLVPTAVQTLFDHGVQRDSADPPVRDAQTTRRYWARYPVLFSR